MSGADKTRAKRNAKQREHTTVKDLADLGKTLTLVKGDWVERIEMPNPLTAPHYRKMAAKGISDAPNLRGDDAQRCGNCQYFTSLPPDRDMAMLTNSIMTNGGICDLYDFEADDFWLCDSWEAQTYNPDPMPVVIVGGKEAKQLPIVLFKQSDGRLRVVGWASNNRRDKDNPPELITEAAHKEFMAHLDANPDRAPEFWHWHTPGTAYAKADCWDYVDGFTVYSGMVYEGKEAQAERAAVDGVGMSHGFRVLGYDEKERLITKYRTFEVSDLPITRAANPYTSYNVIRKEAGMPFSDAKRAYLAEKMGEEAVAKLEARTGEMKAAADALGIESKETTQAKADVADAPVAKPKKKPDTDNTDADSTDTEDAETADETETEQEEMGEEEADEKPADKKPKPFKALSEKEIRAIIRDELATSAASIGTSVGGQVAIALKALNERIDAMETNTTAAKNAAESAATAAAKSLDEAVAEMIAPRRKMNMYSPTADKKNVTGEKTKAAVKQDKEEPTPPNDPGNDWFTTKVLKPAGLAA